MHLGALRNERTEVPEIKVYVLTLKRERRLGYEWESMEEPTGLFDANGQLVLRVSLPLSPPLRRKLPQKRTDGS